VGLVKRHDDDRLDPPHIATTHAQTSCGLPVTSCKPKFVRCGKIQNANADENKLLCQISRPGSSHSENSPTTTFPTARPLLTLSYASKTSLKVYTEAMGQVPKPRQRMESDGRIKADPRTGVLESSHTAPSDDAQKRCCILKHSFQQKNHLKENPGRKSEFSTKYFHRVTLRTHERHLWVSPREDKHEKQGCQRRALAARNSWL
jgi:hypothetical protein